MTEKKGNATFYCFKSDTGKYYAEGRGNFPKEMFDGTVFDLRARMKILLAHNDMCWPGISGPGNDYFRFVVADDDVDWGWPLMFKNDREFI